MTPTMLPGLATPEGATTPAARRHCLLSTAPEVLAEQVVEMARALRAIGLERLDTLAELAGLPLGEVVAAPFGLRAIARSVSVGATTRHHELRLPIEWPEGWHADAIVADEADATWQRGVLHTGKYQSFLQDEPLATYNPAHMSKWAAHELSHRSAGFFWRADMTRWELYLGARLNELAPVVLWYGPDEVLRLDRDGFDRALDQADPEAPIGRARWLHEPEDDLRERARRTVGFLIAGLEHFERELRAIDNELETGRMTSVDHPFLDASSDAAAYVVGHWARLTAAPTRALVEGLLEPGRHYDSSIRAYRGRVERELDELLFAPVALEPAASRARIAGRQLWDWLGRVAQAGPAVFDRVTSLVPEAKVALAEAERGEGPDLDVWAARLAQATGEPELLAAGDLGWAPELVLSQLLDGLDSVVPATTRLSDRNGRLDEWLLGFATSAQFRRRLPLAARIAGYVTETEDDPVVRALLELELALLRATRRDDQVERLSPQANALPVDFEKGRLIANRAFSLVHLEVDVAELHVLLLDDRRIGQAPEPSATTYLVGAYFDGISVLPLPAQVERLWRRLEHGSLAVVEASDALEGVRPPMADAEWPETAGEWLIELISAGAVGWVPAL